MALGMEKIMQAGLVLAQGVDHPPTDGRVETRKEERGQFLLLVESRIVWNIHTFAIY